MSEFHFKRSNNTPKNEPFFRISAVNFPSLKGMAIQDLDMAPGERRTAHLHPNAAQMDYCLLGTGEVGIIGPNGDQHIITLEPGDAAFVPQGYVHWVENKSSENARFILIAAHEKPETIEIQSIFSLLPRDQK
ncbi:cupin domain-containing protein [Mesorhizobium sp. M1307]|uniref:cupin domain-containing protein n=1 Tax=Mesorhizobium sp. M1307 TaxID=2957079 RepID=UPI00333A4DF4